MTLLAEGPGAFAVEDEAEGAEAGEAVDVADGAVETADDAAAASEEAL